MKKKLIAIFSTFLLSSASYAATIKITSFNFSDPNSHVAEICGIVSEITTTPTFLQVVVDETSTKPGNYNSFVGTDGNFCLTVTTFNGTAIAKIL